MKRIWKFLFNGIWLENQFTCCANGARSRCYCVSMATARRDDVLTWCLQAVSEILIAKLQSACADVVGSCNTFTFLILFYIIIIYFFYLCYHHVSNYNVIVSSVILAWYSNLVLKTCSLREAWRHQLTGKLSPSGASQLDWVWREGEAFPCK